MTVPGLAVVGRSPDTANLPNLPQKARGHVPRAWGLSIVPNLPSLQLVAEKAQKGQLQMPPVQDATESMTQRIAALESQLLRVESNLKAAQRRGRNAWIASGAILLSAIMLAANPQVQAQFNITLASLNNRLTAVETKTTPLAYNAGSKLLTISGANVMVVDGSGTTESTTGLGNFQVGYNELRGTGDVRSGTHNLIIGKLNNYSSYGGLVVGANNSISDIYASVSGGAGNSASAAFASVSGGSTNSATGLYSTVSAGKQNLASGLNSAVSGGVLGSATSVYSSVSGGWQSTASGDYSSVSGGVNRSATGTGNWTGGTYTSPN